MRAGLLTEPIEIITSEITKNAYGEEEIIWKTKYKTRARLIHNNGNRSIINSEITYEYNKTFEVRYYVTVDDFDRIIWNGKQYRILDITPDKDQQKLTIISELVND